MPTMSEVRAKFPMYEDVPDDQLLSALHKKHYADMPFEQFNASIDRGQPKAPQPAPYQPYQGIDPGADTERFGENPGTGGTAPTDFLKGVISAPARINRTLEQSSPLSIPGRVLKHALGIDKIDEQYSKAPDSTAGRIGSVVGDVATSLPAVSTLPARILPQIVGNAAIAAAQAPDNPGEAALWGAGGGAVGHTLGKVVGGFNPTAEAKALMERGIQPTAGQAMGRGSWLHRAEDQLAKLPVAGGTIRNTREQALTDFQKASRIAALPPRAGEDAAASIDSLSKAFSEGYQSVLGQARFRPDAQLNLNPTDLVGNVSVMGATKAQMAQARQEVHEVLKHLEDWGATPVTLHQAERMLKEQAYKYKSSAEPHSRIYGEVLAGAADNLRQSWRGGLTPATFNALSALDDAYSKYVPIRRAAANSQGVVEEYTPRALQRAIKAGDKTPNKSRYLAGGEPQQELANAAEKVIGSTVPKPTELGLATMLGAGGASVLGGMTPAYLAAVGAGLGYGSRPVQRALVGDLPGQRALAEALRRFTPATARATNRND